MKHHDLNTRLVEFLGECRKPMVPARKHLIRDQATALLEELNASPTTNPSQAALNRLRRVCLGLISFSKKKRMDPKVARSLFKDARAILDAVDRDVDLSDVLTVEEGPVPAEDPHVGIRAVQAVWHPERGVVVNIESFERPGMIMSLNAPPIDGSQVVASGLQMASPPEPPSEQETPAPPEVPAIDDPGFAEWIERNVVHTTGIVRCGGKDLERLTVPQVGAKMRTDHNGDPLPDGWRMETNEEFGERIKRDLTS